MATLIRPRFVWSLFILMLAAAPAWTGASPQSDDHAEEAPASEAEAGAPTDESSDWDVSAADLGPVNLVRKTVRAGTWISLDVSPDGRWVVFDLLGDIFRMPIEGGRAERLRGGAAYEIQPRISPDGEWISFTSDAGGGDNIWVMRVDGSDARAVTSEDFRLPNNAVWTPDGRSLIARKHFTSRRSLGAGEMWLYDVAAGGSGVRLTERPNDQKDVGEPCVSPDGRYLYYSIDSTPGSRIEYNKDPNAGIYDIRRLDLETGETRTLCDGAGGSARPQLSPDGKQLAFVRRVRLKTVLMLRDLESGTERMLTDGLYRDQQETWAIFGVYPGFAWTPDGASIVLWEKGRIIRVAVADGRVEPIPFEAELELPITEALRHPPVFGDASFPVRVVRWPRVSPRGDELVFQALGHLWIRGRGDDRPRRLTDSADLEFYPRWTPDGRHIVYTSWNDVEGGRVRIVRSIGKGQRLLVERPGHYAEPALSPDGSMVAYRRAGGDGYRGNRHATDTGIYIVPFKGGEARLVSEAGIHPQFGPEGDRLWLFEAGEEKKTLYSIDLHGGDRRDHATSERAMEMLPSPDGRWIAFEELWEVYVAPLPVAGSPVAIGPEMKNLPVRKLSEVAGEFLDWSPDSSELRFGLGPDLFEVEIAELFVHAEETPEAAPRVLELGWDHATDIPSTDMAFVGATVLTMDEGRILEDGVVRVRGNRIVAVGTRDEVDLVGAEIVDVSGKVLMPGFVDVHAHTWSSNLDTHAQRNWSLLANLAFGVTTTHDPSNNTRMIFATSEMVRAGEMLGPRVFSTGTILYGAEGDFKAPTESLDDARRHLRRLQAYGAFSAKSYNQPRREQRQWYIKAARELGMMIVPEGGSTYSHNMTMFLDGHTTLEHAIPLAPLYEDALTLISESRTAYTPTLIVGYGGLWGENHWYQKTDVWTNERLLNFVPRSTIDPRSRRRTMVPEGEFNHITLAATAAEIVRRGGMAQVGAHGQIQGLGVHWEMWMFGQGGLTPLEVLEVGTIRGARSLGLDARIGSVEGGKLADLVVLGSDPRDDLRHTEDVDLVMINGRLFDAMSLEQILPERRSLPPGPPLESIPRANWGVGCVLEEAGVQP